MEVAHERTTSILNEYY